jgi:hypothetical protein
MFILGILLIILGITLFRLIWGMRTQKNNGIATILMKCA